MTPGDPNSEPAVVQLTLGLRFVPRPASEESGSPPGGSGALQNVVALAPQQSWLVARAANGALTLNPGLYNTATGYPVAPFAEFLDGLLAELVDPGVVYSSELFLMDHIIKEGEWIRGMGHMFRLLANGEALVAEARVADGEYDVETLVSVRVIV
jgi:hypothetical protein